MACSSAIELQGLVVDPASGPFTLAKGVRAAPYRHVIAYVEFIGFVNFSNAVGPDREVTWLSKEDYLKLDRPDLDSRLC